MKKVQISFDLEVFDSIEHIAKDEQKLLHYAESSMEKAYAPYSGFKVGAAVALANGEVILGNNQENASYPSGLCAERVAVFQAGALYPGVRIKTIAIKASSTEYVLEKPVAPCGSCRQSLMEYERNQEAPIALVMMGVTGPVYKITSLVDILPLGFEASYLKG